MNLLINKNSILTLFIAILVIFAVNEYLKYTRRDFPIDLVYLWVDGSDEEWTTKKNYWQKELNIDDYYAIHPSRWRDREELRHSLRSVEKYMPWVNKIYIITDNQKPKWLNTDHPKIKIIDHKEILPSDALPLFNSSAIETGIANIKGLSEHFIYANDDVFANKPLPREFFFGADGTPIFYTDKDLSKFYKSLYNKEKKENTTWIKLVDNEKRINDKLNSNLDYFDFVGTHTFTSYRKSDYLQAMKIFANEIRSTVYSKFRTSSDLGRGIVFSYQWKYGKVLVVDSTDVKQYNCNKSGILIMSNISDIKKFDPCSFCLNDYDYKYDDKHNAHTELLRKKFPYKSEFEIN